MNDFDLQPTLVTPHLVLRPLAAADWEALYSVARDPLIWAIHPAHDRWTEPVFRQFFADALDSGGALAILNARNGEIVGSSRYDSRRAGPGEIEIGWTFLARRYWDGVTNAEMKRAMLTHAFQYVERVIFLVGEDNVRSRRAMAKIGGQLTDRLHEAEMAGRPMRHVVYAIDRSGFADGLLTRFPV
jgi:N-acetyltransferase